MDTVIVMLLVVGFSYLAFINGKRIGSRLGFGASRRMSRRRFR